MSTTQKATGKNSTVKEKKAKKALGSALQTAHQPSVVFESLKPLFGKQECLVGRMQIKSPVSAVGSAQAVGKKQLMGKRGLMCALCLDTSGSMSAPACVIDGQALGGLSMFAVANAQHGVRTRLQECQRAIESLLPQLDHNDYLSLTVFSSGAQTLFEASPMNEHNKQQFLKVLQTVVASGSTALFEGWQMAAQSACAGLKMDLLSRVIVLTDGEATTQKAPQVIGDAVQKLAQVDVSTSCFGVGAQFNEDLLTHMSAQGKGNFRYIPDAQMAQKAAQDELMGLSALRAKNVRVTLEAKEQKDSGVQSISIEGLSQSADGSYACANVVEGKTQQYAVVVKMDPQSLKKHVPITMHLWYETLQGVALEQQCEWIFERSLEQEVVQSAQDKEVQGLWASAQASVQKVALANAVAQGRWDEADKLLSTTTQIVGSMSLESSYAQSEHADIERLARAVRSKDAQGARKEALFQSYSRVSNQTVRMEEQKEADPKKG